MLQCPSVADCKAAAATTAPPAGDGKAEGSGGAGQPGEGGSGGRGGETAAAASKEKEAEKPEEMEESVFHQLQSVFGALQGSALDHYIPSGFWHAYKDYDGLPINVQEHQDAFEFFTRLQEQVSPARALARNIRSKILSDLRILNRVLA